MDDNLSFRQLLAQHQENMGAASAIALICAVCYAAFKHLKWRESLMAAGAGALFAAFLWLFLASWVHPAVIILLPVAIACGVLAFPVMKAYCQRDEKIASDVVDGAEGILKRLVRRVTGGDA
jgi:apolipoprotein N-acyltransferase